MIIILVMFAISSVIGYAFGADVGGYSFLMMLWAAILIDVICIIRLRRRNQHEK